MNRQGASGSMALQNSLSLLLALQVSSTYAQGLEGYGLTSYDPVCAEACLRSFTPLMLPCSSMHDGHMATPPACRANDTAFLTSVAWCMSDNCADEKLSKIEGYWEEWITGSKFVPAKWSYSEALMEVDPKPPRYQLNMTDKVLNQTSTLAPVAYLSQWNSLWATNHEMIMGARYGYVTQVSLRDESY